MQGEQNDAAESKGDAADGQGRGTLGAEDEKLTGKDPDGNHGGNDGGDARRNTRLGPEERGVYAGEHDKAERGRREELAWAERRAVAQMDPDEQKRTGDGEAKAGREKRGEDRDDFADGEERTAPQNIDSRVGEQLAGAHKPE